MKFNDHSTLSGCHAFLSASDYHWLNDDPEKLKKRRESYNAKLRGTKLHELAKDHIDLKIKMGRAKTTFNMFVNDAIGFGMKSEVTLFHSVNAFGTADAICFSEETKKLRIHDLKTGKTPASMKQLMIYAALFCLEYGYRPGDISIELRIYQNDEVEIFEPTAEDIAPIMSKIVANDKLLRKWNMEE